MATLGELGVGDKVALNISGVLQNFLVAHQGNPGKSVYDASCDGTWLMMENIESKMQFHPSSNVYAASSVHSYLNDGFLNKLDSEVKAAIKTVKIPYTSSGTTVLSGSKGLECKAFIPSAAETLVSGTNDEGEPLTYFREHSKFSPTYFNGVNTSWWLRTPNDTTTNNEYYIDTTAQKTYSHYVYDSFGVRPVFVLPSSATIHSDGSVTIPVTISMAAAQTNTTPITLCSVKLEGSLPKDVDLHVEVSNNANATTPVWEDATGETKLGWNHRFKNTANSTAFNYRITAQRGASNVGGSISKVTTAFK